MNREIKFRGKRIDNGEWFFGDLMKLHTEIELDARYIHSGVNQPVMNDFWEDFQEVIPESVGQFTGLHDKNGKEIYEGDIIVRGFNSNIMEVVWIKELAMFISRGLDCHDNPYLWFDYEIIGNIHDNPELLKNN